MKDTKWISTVKIKNFFQTLQKQHYGYYEDSITREIWRDKKADVQVRMIQSPHLHATEAFKT